jgi:hypothetical protein
MVAVAVVGLVLAAFLVTTDLERRAILCHREAEYHRWSEDQTRTRAAYLESLAHNPSRYYELLVTLSSMGKQWQERALEASLELMDDESITRSKRWYPEARDVASRRAREYRRESEYHGRRKERYQRAAFDLRHSVEPDPPKPH